MLYSQEEINARIQVLEAQVRYHNELYWEKEEPEISDSEYDAIVRELVSLDPDNPALFEIGGTAYGAKKVKHPTMMGSQSKCHTADEIREWMASMPEGTAFIVMLKIDGLACRAEYDDGQLVIAATRGKTGLEGEDVTENVRAAIPEVCKLGNFTGEVRAEVHMSWERFRALNENPDVNRTFANPRNAASGTLGQKEAAEAGKRGLDFMIYDIRPSDTPLERLSHVPCYAKSVLGLDSSFYVSALPVTPDTIGQLLAEVAAKRESLPIPIDGLVISVDDNALIEELGYNGKCPRAQIAYKFPAQQAKTKLLGIAWQVGRTGRLTPVAKLEPVSLDGSTISSPTLHNVANIRTKDVEIGDIVVIEKAGDIIPQVVRVAGKGDGHGQGNWREAVNYPVVCPCCGQPTEEDENGVNVWCVNPTCEAQLEEKILHWVRTIDLKGVGEGAIASLRQAGHLDSIVALYSLDIDKVREVTGGERSAEVIVNAVNSKKSVPVATFVAALGIHMLGNTFGKELAKRHKTLEAIRALTYDELISIEGIGERKASTFVSGFERLSDTIDDLLKVLEVEDVIEKTGVLLGKSFCITGSLSQPKKKVYAMIEEAGGEAWTSVKKGLTYLVQADPSSQSKKTQKAEKIGTEVISEEQVMEMLNG